MLAAYYRKEADVPDIDPSGRTLLWVQRAVARAGAGVETVAMVMGSILLVVVFLCLLLQVIYRYVLFLPLPWSEEAARFGLVWLGMLAAVVAARRGLHFIFRFGTLFLTDELRRWLRVVVGLLVIFFLAVLSYEGWIYLGIVDNQTAPATGLNMIVPYSGIFIGGLMMLAVYVVEVLDALLGCVSGVRYSEAEAEEVAVYKQLGRWCEKGDAGVGPRDPTNRD
jgi:C4-dicarboxylate transporter, DctQ subunit